MAAAATRADEVANFFESGIRFEYAVACRPHYSRYEYCAVVHEGEALPVIVRICLYL